METPKIADNRALPQQVRSRKRYDAILDAAAQVFAERGFEEATTQEIAERAHTSIGSLYRFFANKPALFRAMVERYAARAEELLERMLANASSQSIPELIDTIVDASVALDTQETGWRALWMNLHLYGEMGDADRELRARQLQRADALVGQHAPHLDDHQREVVARTTMRLFNTMLPDIIENHEPPMRDELLDELKKVVRLYIESNLTDKDS